MGYIKVEYIGNCYSRGIAVEIWEMIFIGYMYRILKIAGFPHF